MYRVQVKVVGDAPLLMHKFNPSTGLKRQKVYDPKIEAENAAYRTSKGKLCLPSSHFEASIAKAGAEFPYKGKKNFRDYLKAGIFIEENDIIIEPQKYEIHTSPAVINRSRIWRWRPIIKDWSCSFTIQIINEDIGFEQLKAIVIDAGKFTAVGDWRPKYGRYHPVSFKKISA